MPIPDEMDRRLRECRVADLLQHDWIRWGGGLYAGAFLRAFTQGRDWAPLDIAGPAFLGGPVGHLTAGGTGFTRVLGCIPIGVKPDAVADAGK